MRVISGRFKGRALKTVAAEGMRPATGKVREALLSMLVARGAIFPGARVLDLFAGSGSVGIEALSRGAGTAVFVEANPAVAKVLRQNLAGLSLSPGEARVVTAEVGKSLPKLAGEAFDLVLVDPPYGLGLLAPTLAALVTHGLIAEDGVVAAEVEASLPLAGLPAPLKCLTERTYGQTRIILCRLETNASPSTPAPSTP